MRQVLATVEAARAALSAAPEATKPEPADSASGALFRRDGEFWTIQFQGLKVLMKDAKGLQLLHRLIAAQGSSLHVLDLVSGGRAGPGGAFAGELGEGWSLDGLSAEPLLDPAAKAAYRARLEELNRDIEEAENHHDLGRVSAGRAELQFVLDELARATGLAGRDRRVASPAERARSSVSKAIRSSIRRIQAVHPELGAHLAATVTTGYHCSYRSPEPVDWST
jgi:hypothetical protein